MGSDTRGILIDVTRLVGRLWKGRLPTGIDRVGVAYIEHYHAHARATIYWLGLSFVLPRRESALLFQWIINTGGRAKLVNILAKSLLLGWRNQKVTGCFLFNTGHKGLERIDYPNSINRMQVLPVFVVHDLIPITHPEYCRTGEKDRHIVRMNNVLGQAKGVIVNSQATLDELRIFAEVSGKRVPLSTVALLAPGLSSRSVHERPMAEPYFVVLSSIEPRKNHWLLLQVWKRLIESVGNSAPRLVIIGQRGWECENVVYMLDRCSQLQEYVIKYSNCTDKELATYLAHTQALLFPSFAEGYGMPLVEALAFGAPVIASDLPVFREVAGEIPDYVDPLDGKQWLELVKEYSRPDSKLRSKQLDRLKDFSIPTWTSHFTKVDALLEQLDRKRQMIEQSHIAIADTSKIIYGYGFSLWKKPIVRRFFAKSKIVFVRSASRVPAGSTLVVWGCNTTFDKLNDDIQLLHLEDGFLRSVGLGAELIRPLSWVIDTRGIYYDATRWSDLEHLLQTNKFSDVQISRAYRFRRRIVSAGLTKYNVGNTYWQRPAGDRQVILVPGQVESDASLRYGAPGIRTNLGLVQAVRKANPDAYIVYKSHPDVLSGLKAKGDKEHEVVRWCDEAVANVSMGELLPVVDEVHVLTSLTGFEALLRDKAVTCYGQPFYSGWGLTKDLLPVPRRTRVLTLDQLVSAALILYPRYVSYSSNELCTPEKALDELLVWRNRASPPQVCVSLRRMLLRAMS